MRLRALFLDVGDTLLTERVSRFELYAAAARARGAAVDGPTMRTLMREAHHELPREIDGAFRYTDPWFGAFIEHIFGRRLGLSATGVAGLTEELFATFERAETFRVYPGALRLLRDLRERGVARIVVSNWSARLERVLEAVGLASELDSVVCSALVGAEKPERAIFQRALERAGVRPGETLHAGDHLRKDVAGARAAGLAAVLVDHAGHLAEPAEEQGVDRVQDLDALRAYSLDRI